MIAANQKDISSLTPTSGGRGITLTGAGKRFNREWIFRHLNYSFETGISYAITGPNGSGKSTLLQVIAGSMHLSEGTMAYGICGEENGNKTTVAGDKESDTENIYRSIAITAPYLELIEEMTATEFLRFHAHFKPLIAAVAIPGILSLIGLEKAADKQIRYYSSGMKQRLKLAQAVFSDVPVLLLDEPCTNLDAAGYTLYHTLIAGYCSNKLVIVSSNDALEIDFCTERIHIMDFKP